MTTDDVIQSNKSKVIRDSYFENGGLIENDGDNSRSSFQKSDNLHVQVPSIDHKLLLFDVKDALNTLEEKYRQALKVSEQSTVGQLTTTTSVQAASIDTPYLYTLMPLIDRMSRFITIKSSVDVEEINNNVSRMMSIFVGIIECNSISQDSNIKLLCCRCLLRLVHPYLAQFEASKGEVTLSVDVLLFVTRTLYAIHAENKSFVNKQAQSRYVELDTIEIEDDSYEIDCEDEGAYLGRAGSNANKSIGSTDETIHTVIDIMVDILKTSWGCIELIQSLKTSSDTKVLSINVEKLVESVIYMSGVFRVFTGDEVNRKRLSHMGFIQSICFGIQTVSRAYSQSEVEGEGKDACDAFCLQCSQLMLQLVSIVRNFVSDSHCKRQLLAAEVAPVMCSTVHVFKLHPELVLNCSRVLSKLSLQDKHRDQINKRTYYLKCLVEVIVNEAKLCSKLQRVAWLHHESNGATEKVEGNVEWPSWSTWPLLSRIAFTLGNLTTSNESNRKLIGINCKILKPVILLLQTCCCSLIVLMGDGTSLVGEKEGYRVDEADSSRDDDIDNDDIDNDDNDDTEEDPSESNGGEKDLCDATIKLLRLLANLCMEEEVGSIVATRPEMFNVITELLRELLQSPVGSRSVLTSSNEIVSVVISKKFRDVGLLLFYEELMLNAIALSTNITYYACRNLVASQESQMSSPQKHFVSVASNLSKYLFHENDEIVLETCRALGNLTRIQSVLKAFKGSRIDEAMCILLRHVNKDVVCSTVGIFINLTSSKDRYGEIVLDIITNKKELLDALLSTLRRLSLKYLHISILVCKVLHNMINLQQQENFCLPENLKMRFIETLRELLDCAHDLRDDGNKNVNEFIKIGCVVLGLLQK